MGFHQYRNIGNGYSGKLYDFLSARLAYGLGDHTEIQIRYERIRDSGGINYISVTPKLSVANEAFAFFLPVGLIFRDGEPSGLIIPTLMFTKRVGKKFEGSLSAGMPVNIEYFEFRLDIVAGFGLSSDLDKWAIRPEIGILVDAGESDYILHFGIATKKIFKHSLMTPTRKNEKIKEYVAGDDFRTVNWKATAKSNKLMVNQYQDERSQSVYFILDKGRVMKMPFDGLSLLD